MKKSKSYRSDFLFVTPTFLMGAGSVLNIAGNYFSFNYSLSDKQADTEAICSDWGLVGGDIEKASEAFTQNLEL